MKYVNVKISAIFYLAPERISLKKHFLKFNKKFSISETRRTRQSNFDWRKLIGPKNVKSAILTSERFSMHSKGHIYAKGPFIRRNKFKLRQGRRFKLQLRS